MVLLLTIQIIAHKSHQVTDALKCSRKKIFTTLELTMCPKLLEILIGCDKFCQSKMTFTTHCATNDLTIANLFLGMKCIN